tara:strand:- start:577 stop:831 length:255 start_codon:yes stop_codon:yes gene_type:complete
MSDEGKKVKFELLGNNTTRMTGLFGCEAEGLWEKGTAVDYPKDGVWASFDFPKFRILMKSKRGRKDFSCQNLAVVFMERKILDH